MKRKRRRARKRLNLSRSLFLLPTMVTLSSVFCGFYSMVITSGAQGSEDLNRAALLIVFAMLFDMLDGRVARMTKTESAFGLQIDSLADVISFGAAPALLIYHFSLHQLGLIGILGGFAFTACGAIRLARFNVLSTDPSGAVAGPSKHIIGLPIPPAAGVLVGIVIADHAVSGGANARHYSEILLAVTLGTAVLMVSSVRFRSFKDLKLDVRSVLLVGFFVASAAAVAIELSPAFILLWLLACYLTLGICEWLLTLCRKLVRRSADPSERALRARVDND